MPAVSRPKQIDALMEQASQALAATDYFKAEADDEGEDDPYMRWLYDMPARKKERGRLSKQRKLVFMRHRAIGCKSACCLTL